MDAAVPAIEIPHNADAQRVRSPDREMHASNALERLYVSAQLFVSVVVAAFAHEIEVKFREKKWKGVRVVGFPDVAIFVTKAEAVTGGWRRMVGGIGKRGLEEALFAEARHGYRVGTVLQKDLGLHRARVKCANRPAATLRGIRGMRAQDAKGIGISRGQEGVDPRLERVLDSRFRCRRGKFRHGAILAEAGQRTNKRGA